MYAESDMEQNIWSFQVLVYEYLSFEDHSLFHRKPVKRFEDFGNVGQSRSNSNKACQTILNVL